MLWVERMALYGSTTEVEIFGELNTLKPTFYFLVPYSTDNLLSINVRNPEPVPPPTELYIKNPSRFEQLSASFLMQSRDEASMSLPTWQYPLVKLFEASYFPDINKEGLKRFL